MGYPLAAAVSLPRPDGVHPGADGQRPQWLAQQRQGARHAPEVAHQAGEDAGQGAQVQELRHAGGAPGRRLR